SFWRWIMVLRQYMRGIRDSWKSAARRRPPADARRKPRSRLTVECLEDRLTPAYLWVDFGFAFPGGALTVTDSQMNDPGVNGPSNDGTAAKGPVFGNGYSLISLTQTVMNRKLDFNGDGAANATDARLLANQVLADVRRAYEPFNVNVVEIASTD